MLILIIILIILLFLTTNKKEIYRSGKEQLIGSNDEVYTIQKKHYNHRWYSIYQTTSEQDWINKISEMKKNSKNFI